MRNLSFVCHKGKKHKFCELFVSFSCLIKKLIKNLLAASPSLLRCAPGSEKEKVRSHIQIFESWREKWSSDDNDILINTGRFVAKCSNHTCPCRDHQGHTWSLQQTTKSWGNLSHRQWCRKKIADASINGNIIGALKNIDIIDDAKKRGNLINAVNTKNNLSDVICGAKTLLFNNI